MCTQLTTEVKMEGGPDELTMDRTGDKIPLLVYRGPSVCICTVRERDVLDHRQDNQ